VVQPLYAAQPHTALCHCTPARWARELEALNCENSQREIDSLIGKAKAAHASKAKEGIPS